MLVFPHRKHLGNTQAHNIRAPVSTQPHHRGECVRLKDFVVNALITDSTITNCGIHDYEFGSDEKNGEGVYIGTSSTQVRAWV